MKFRKKPVVIEATQWFKYGDHPAVRLVPRQTRGEQGAWHDLAPQPSVVTLEGLLEVTPGDWIITGVNGEHYPCKPDIFEATYERVE